MLSTVLLILYYILLGYGAILGLNIIFSWIPFVYKYKIPRILKTMGNWYLDKFRGVLVIGIFDFTTMIGIFLYYFIIDSLFYII